MKYQSDSLMDRYDFSGKSHMYYIGWGGILVIGAIFMAAIGFLAYYLFRLSNG